MFAWPDDADEDRRVLDWLGSGIVPLTGSPSESPRIPRETPPPWPGISVNSSTATTTEPAFFPNARHSPDSLAAAPSRLGVAAASYLRETAGPRCLAPDRTTRFSLAH